MNRARFRDVATSSPHSTNDDDDDDDDDDDEEDWSTDESSSTSSLHDNSAPTGAARPSNHRRNQTHDGNPPNNQPHPVKSKKKQRRPDFQLPLVPYIDPRSPPHNQSPSQTRHPHTTRTHTHTHTPRHGRPPLIELIQNEWHNARSKPSGPHPHGDVVPSLEQILSAPKVRRWGLVGLVILGLVWVNWGLWARARWREHALLKNAVSEGGGVKAGFGVFGTNARPEFGGMVHLRSLGEDYGVGWRGGDDRSTRLVVVGDVHGCIDELQNLLAEVSFNADHDHLICTGDIISKGPSSGEVIDLLISMKASCVRGNHEDRILLTYQDLQSRGLILPETQQPHQPSSSSTSKDSKNSPSQSQKPILADDQSDQQDESADRDRDLARSLTPSQVQYLSSCPVILRLGSIPGMGETLVVHGGLVPGVALEKQDPVSVMNMRTLDLESRVPSRSAEGTAWNELWTKFQTYLPPAARSTVIYGHDSRRGLQLTQYAKGLDTGCVKGGRLTALVIRYDGSEPAVVSVQCRDYRAKKKKSAGEVDG